MYEALYYERTFLTQVISRVDFVAASEVLQRGVPSRLAKTISDHFPIVEPAESLTQELLVRPGERIRAEKESSFRQWNFYGREREKLLSIAPSFLFVTYFRYTTYEDMKQDFSAVVNATESTMPDLRAGRFGLRYINNVEIEGLAPPVLWNEYIAERLLGVMEFAQHEQHLTRVFHVVELKDNDLDIKFQFGMPNPDYPATIKRPLFVLDIDAYVQTAHELKQSLVYMDQAHNHIQRLFEESITDKLRERMRVKQRQAIQ